MQIVFFEELGNLNINSVNVLLSWQKHSVIRKAAQRCVMNLKRSPTKRRPLEQIWNPMRNNFPQFVSKSSLKSVDCVPLRNKSQLSEIDKQVLNRRATLLKKRFELPKRAWIKSKPKHSPVAAEQKKSDNDLLRMKHVECNSIRKCGN